MAMKKVEKPTVKMQLGFTKAKNTAKLARDACTGKQAALQGLRGCNEKAAGQNTRNLRAQQASEIVEVITRAGAQAKDFGLNAQQTVIPSLPWVISRKLLPHP